MAITEHKDIEKGDKKGLDDLVEPFIDNSPKNVKETEEIEQNYSIGMVLLSTAVAVCGSLEFGSCVSL